ncbi:MAG TPA: ribosome silencing factor [Nitrospiria bacterium]|nr:ribosome silencing factor [Nitrospiria bacterium]
MRAAQAALEKKASDLIVFKVGGLTTVADYFVICSADSQRQVRAIRDHIDDTLSQRGCHLFSTEGEATGRWVLMDYSDIVVHIFKEEIRSFYALERLWGDAPRLDLKRELQAGFERHVGKVKAARGGGRLRANKG